MFIFSRFEELRSSQGITKKKIADALNRKPAICQDWKAGKSTPSEDQLSIIAEILHTTPAYLTGESDEKSPPQGDGLSDRERAIIEKIHSLPVSRRESAYTAVEAILLGLSLRDSGEADQ